MVDVWLATTDGHCLVMPRHTQPEAEHKMLLKLLGLSLPPPPRITAEQVPPAEKTPSL